MFKKIICLFVSCIMTFFSFAQHDDQQSIYTEDGIFTVSKTGEGKDMIRLSISLWDDMVKGTKYNSRNLVLFKEKMFFIEIANKKQWHCNKGIGFRCGIFDRPANLKNIPATVNHANRICTATIQKQDSCTVRIIFLDNIDWDSLQNGQ